MPVLRTPENRFNDLPGFPYPSQLAKVGDLDGDPMRMSYGGVLDCA